MNIIGRKKVGIKNLICVPFFKVALILNVKGKDVCSVVRNSHSHIDEH